MRIDEQSLNKIKKILLTAYSTDWKNERDSALSMAAQIGQKFSLTLEEIIIEASIDKSWAEHFRELRKAKGDSSSHHQSNERASSYQEAEPPRWGWNYTQEQKHFANWLLKRCGNNEIETISRACPLFDQLPYDLLSAALTDCKFSDKISDLVEEAIDIFMNVLVKPDNPWLRLNRSILSIRCHIIVSKCLDIKCLSIKDIHEKIVILKYFPPDDSLIALSALQVDIQNLDPSASVDPVEEFIRGLPEKRRAIWRKVVLLSKKYPEMTLRAIAAKAGCCPQTVQNIQKKLGI